MGSVIVGRQDDACLDELPDVDRSRLERMVERGRIRPAELQAFVDRHLRLDKVGRGLTRGDMSIDQLTEAEPSIAAAFAIDIENADVLDRWGLSTTVDDEPLVPAPVITWIADALGRPADPTRCHAGLVHTYGYLFSPVGTDYGRKRHRWTTQEAAHALGIPGDWPLNSRVGILTAVTEVLETVAPLDREPPTMTTECALNATVTADVGGFGTTTNGTPWTSRFRVVRRAELAASERLMGDELLLVYSLTVADGPERYITAFPVSESYAAHLEMTVHDRLRFLAVAG